MASAHPILERLESTIGRYRDTIARLTPELAHLREEKEIIMQFLSDFGPALKTLIDLRQSADEKADAEGKRADTAEADAADLRKQIAADEATLKAMLDDVNGEIAEEKLAPSAPSPDATVTTSPTGATVTVDPTVGTTTHVDPAANVTTTLDHASGTVTAVDTSISPAQPVEAAPAAVAEATQATTDAGVTVATPEAPAAALVI